jgi:hypothetical protein
MLRGERKSVEPIAAVTAPARVAAQHQSLRHFVGEGRASPSCVGASSATISNSSKKSVSGILKVGGGVAFTITRRSASRLTDS